MPLTDSSIIGFHRRYLHASNKSLGGISALCTFRKRTLGFETMLWRVSHGNIFVKFADIDEAIEDPKTGDMLDKAVFIVFYQVNRNIANRLGSEAFVLLALFCVLLFMG